MCIFLLLCATLYNCSEVLKKKKKAYAEIVILVAVHYAIYYWSCINWFSMELRLLKLRLVKEKKTFHKNYCGGNNCAIYYKNSPNI